MNVALKACEQLVARGEPIKEPYLGWKKWYDDQFPLLKPDPSKNLGRSTTMDDAGPYLKVAPVPPRRLPRRRDSSIASPISEPGSPVANDFVPINQIHRKKPYLPSMENEFASPPRDPRRKPRRDEQGESARKDGSQETQRKSPSKKISYNADRDTKECLVARRLSGQQ